MPRKWTGYSRYEPEWYDDWPVRKVVRSELEGSVLAFPAGRSPIGDLSVDVDRAVSPDVLADLEACPFKPRSFDTVYCDPPYDLFYGSHKWIENLWAVARRKLILQCPPQRVCLDGTTKRWVLVEPTPGSAERWVLSLQILTPANRTLP